MATIEQDYADKRPKSKALHERAAKRMPSGVAHDGRSFAPFPFYVARADGARKWDVDGHEYIDCWSGHGALMLGHNHPAVLKAIQEQARLGTHYSACSEIEVRWAELICSIVPGAERVRFMMTGTETTALAIRVARAVTGRNHIVKFEAHFHGLHDAVMAAVKDPFEIPVSAGVPPSTLSTTLVARNNDLAHVKELLDDHEVAAVILEPAGARSMTVPTDPAFLKALRRLTRDRGVILIFDEVVTGFRMAPGGAQEYYGVTADLTCLAKAVAGGLPGAALVGRADLLDAITLTGDAKRDRTRRVARDPQDARGAARAQSPRRPAARGHERRAEDARRRRLSVRDVVDLPHPPRRHGAGAGDPDLYHGRHAARSRHGPARRRAAPGHAAQRRRLQPRRLPRLDERRDEREGRRHGHRRLRPLDRPPARGQAALT